METLAWEFSMFDTLIASRSSQRAARAGSVGLLSLSLHGVLILGAFWATSGDAVPSPPGVVAVAIAAPPSAPRPPAPSPAPVVPKLVGGLDFPLPTVPPIAIPPIDGGLTYDPRQWMPPGIAPVDQGENPGALYSSALVDEAPAVLFGPPPVYPERLRQAGIQGRVMIEVVVDTAGRAEPGSIRVIHVSHPGFADPARAYARQVLFRPARVGGRVVRVLVRLPIDFALRRQ